MTPVQQQTYKPKDLSVSLGLATNITVTNLTLTSSNTEYSHAFQTGVRYFVLRARNNAKLQIAFASGESSTKFVTIPNGCTFDLPDLSLTGKMIYIQSNIAGTVVELLETF